jgi:heparosan-N-sulfate-glucuronate 5-epimerase
MYDQTGDQKYLDTCKTALRPFYTSVGEGRSARDFQGHTFPEEYPTVLTNYTLNGFMFTIICVFDLWQITGDESVGALLYAELMETLKLCLPYIDANGISLVFEC